MRLGNREEICTLIFQGVTERVIIGQNENGQWEGFYLDGASNVIAHLSEGRDRRPLKRIVRFEIQPGPYSWQYRDGKERPAEQYTIWTAELPKGKKHPRFIAVLQKMNPARSIR